MKNGLDVCALLAAECRPDNGCGESALPEYELAGQSRVVRETCLELVQMSC